MRLLFFLLFWGAETGIDGGRSEGGRSRSGRGRARVGAGERGAGGGEGGRAFALFGGALRRKDGRGLRALRGRDDSFRLVHGINNPSVRLVPRPTPSRAVETALSSPQSQHVRLCVPRGLTARLASPLPTHLLRICAGALYFTPSGKEPRGMMKHRQILPQSRCRLTAERRDSSLREGAVGIAEIPTNTPSVMPSKRASDAAPPSRAVETALSSPQSSQVRRCVPRGLTARLASPLPTHLLRICAGALKRHEQCTVSKFASGQSPTGLFARKHLLTPRRGA